MILRRTLWTCLLLSCGPLQSRAADPELPRIDSARIVYMYDRGTELARLPNGGVAIDVEITPLHDGCRERYAAREFPFPHAHLRSPHTGKAGFNDYVPLVAVNEKSVAYYLDPSEDQKRCVLWTIAGGQLNRREFSGYYYEARSFPNVPDAASWVGRSLLVDQKQTVWVVGTDRIFTLTGEQSHEISLPALANADENQDLSSAGSYWANQLFRIGDSLWLTRRFTSNCHTTGSFVIRIADDSARIVTRLKEEFADGVIHHNGRGYLLVDHKTPDNIRDTFIPHKILMLSLAVGPDRSAAEIHAAIADLENDEFATRQRATKILSDLPESRLGLLNEALRKTTGEESTARLHQAIDAIVARGTDVQVTKLADWPAARLLFVDPDGRQYVQAWRAGEPQTKMLIIEEKAITPVDLPSKGFVIDCVGDNGRLYAHDEAKLYTIDRSRNQITPIASLGTLAGHELHIVATRKSWVCLAFKVGKEYEKEQSIVWLNLAEEPGMPLLRGESIAERLPVQDNLLENYPTVRGPGGRLWFIRHGVKRSEVIARLGPTARVTTQLCRAEAGKVTELGEPLATGFNPSIWPLSRGTAIVPTIGGDEGINGVLFHDRGTTERARSLKALVETYHERLMEVMPDGAAFTAGADWQACCLVRLGDALYIKQKVYVAERNGMCGDFAAVGVFRGTDWAIYRQEKSSGEFDPLLAHIVGVDAKMGAVLGFDKQYATLQWMKFDGATITANPVHSQEGSWASTWPDCSALPQLSCGWTLTPEAAAHWKEVYPIRLEEARQRGSKSPEWDAQVRSADLASVRRWEDGQWRVLPHSLQGGSTWQDADDGTWSLRQREAEVLYPDKPSQLIPLDATSFYAGRLTVESTHTVWVTTQQSLLRFRRETDAAKPKYGLWVLDRGFQLPRLGVDFAGPWIAGKHMYWVSGQQLYVALLANLTGTEGIEKNANPAANPAALH